MPVLSKKGKSHHARGDSRDIRRAKETSTTRDASVAVCSSFLPCTIKLETFGCYEILGAPRTQTSSITTPHFDHMCHHGARTRDLPASRSAHATFRIRRPLVSWARGVGLVPLRLQGSIFPFFNAAAQHASTRRLPTTTATGAMPAPPPLRCRLLP